MMGECRGCGERHVLDKLGFCIPCSDDLREMVDEFSRDKCGEYELDEGGEA